MALVDPDEVATYLQRRVSARSADLAVRMAESWVRPLVRSILWPPDREQHSDIWSAVVELAALAVDNPTSMGSSVVGGQTDSWVVARRGEILADVEKRYGSTAPLGAFPPPVPWPDDADRGPRW